MSLVEQRRESRRLDEAFVRQCAESAWSKMTKDQKTIVCFGMTPLEIVEDYEKKLAEYVKAAGGETTIESKDFPVALMKIADREVGMRA